MITGKIFAKVLHLDEGKYAVWWSWASNNDLLLIGEYGEKSSDPKVYVTRDGLHFEVFFDFKQFHPDAKDEYHIHKVSVDPYHPLIYVSTNLCVRR